MSVVLTLFAAVTIAFPKPGMKLPAISRCYVIGATDDPNARTVLVAGESRPVHATGAWTARVDVTPGVNTVRVENATCVFTVAPKVIAKAGPSKPAPKPRVYEKLSYAADTPEPPPAGRTGLLVYIDPGHGGAQDLGCVSPHGWPEKEANLLLSEEVKLALEKRGFTVRMTRRNDRALPLYERARAAHAEHAAAFVSIHHNAPGADADVGAIRHSETYAWNDLGLALAKCVAARLKAFAGAELKDRGALKANFAVTRSPQVPSILVEADFLTHPDGEAAAWNADRRRRQGEAIAAGIADWAALR